MKIEVSQKDLATLVKLIDAANNGRAKDFNGNDIRVSEDLFESTQLWSYMAQGMCESCNRDFPVGPHPINEDGSCGLTEENAAQYGFS